MAATTPVPERKRAAEVLPSNLPPVAGSLEQAAALIGVSSNTYLEMERQGIMPGPVRFGRRCLYDFEAVRAVQALAMHECQERNDADAAR